MIRTVQLSEITENIKEMCIEANHFLSPDMAEAMKQAQQNEKSPLGKQILGQLQENLEIAAQDRIPICQEWQLSFWRSDRRYTLKAAAWKKQ